MSLPHFYLDNLVLGECTGEVVPLRLNADDAKHFKVLRLKSGEHIAVIDAASDYFECEIVDENWDAPTVRICSHETDSALGPKILLVQGIAKGDKMDTVMRGSTEVGIAGMVAAPFARCVVNLDGKQAAHHLQRWETIAKSAAMQSGRRAIPEVKLLGKVAELADCCKEATAVLVFWEEATLEDTISKALDDALAKMFCPAADARIVVVIGPEGGLEGREVEWLHSLNPRTYTCTLGNTILRTETAGIVAPALVLYELARMGGAGEQ